MRLNDLMNSRLRQPHGLPAAPTHRFQWIAVAFCLCLPGALVPAMAEEVVTLTAEADAGAAEGPAEAYYRWIDGEGRVQYTDFEPVGIPAQRISLTPSDEDQAPAITSAGEDGKSDPFHDQDAQILPIEHIGPCADARQQLAVLYAAVPVYRDDEGQYRAAWRGDTYRGERQWLDADDRTAAISRARAAVLHHCSDPKAVEREIEAFDSEVGKH